MSILSERMPALPGSQTVRAAGTVLGLTLGGGVAGILGAAVFGVVGTTLGIADSETFSIANVGVQMGFGAVALGYLAAVDERPRYLKIRWPTLEDVGWVLVLPVLLGVAGLGLNAALSWVGVATPSTSHGAQGTAAVLADRPILWVVAIPVLYLFAAPAEELLYRGIVQGRLRSHMGTVGVVLTSGIAFGLMHAVLGLVSSVDTPIYWIASTGLGGILWAFVYERTENLAVTATSHAMSWTLPFSTLLPFL